MLKPCNNILEVLPFLKAISDENRLKIVCFLKDGPKCVCDIVKFTGLAQNLVSHHLKRLREFGIVNFKKDGLKVIYFLKDEKIKKYLKNLNNLFLE